jgi:hypothetical protein
MTTNKTIEALRDLTYDISQDNGRPLTASEIVSQAFLDLPPDVWGNPVVRDYCAADQRLASLALWPGETLTQWAHDARTATCAPAVATLYYTGLIQERGGFRSPLCDVAQELWRYHNYAPSWGVIDKKSVWVRVVDWARGSSYWRSTTGGEGPNVEEGNVCSSFHWDALLAAGEIYSASTLNLSVTWNTGRVREVHVEMGDRFATHLNALRERRGTPADLYAARAALERIGDEKRAPGWLSAHLCATGDPAAIYLAALQRGHLDPAQGLAARSAEEATP